MKNIMENYLTTNKKIYETLKNELMKKDALLMTKYEKLSTKLNSCTSKNENYWQLMQEQTACYSDIIGNRFFLDVLETSYKGKFTNVADVRRIFILRDYYTQYGTYLKSGYIFPDGMIVNTTLNRPVGSMYELYAFNLKDMRKYFPLFSNENLNLNYANATFLAEGNLLFTQLLYYEFVSQCFVAFD